MGLQGVVYRWYGLRRRCDRLVPPAVVLEELCELVLPRGMPQTNLAAVSGRSRSGRQDRWTHTRDLGVKGIDAKFLSVQKHRPNSNAKGERRI
ncbi:hypothetical protein Taro_049421 [Colocasia esculenta]|uniref:Uncharacterized protein n=1 Tax=Colocasia esculenta TaxID=4460 RepID=A0A843XAY3_COLES|nr:hypothetical protein [Colocasia esculenta]